MRDLFARLVGVNPVTPLGYPGYPDVLGRGNRETSYNINAVTLDTPVTPENGLPRPIPDHTDLMDAYEERAAILEFDAHLPRAEVERIAWHEVFGGEER